MKKGIVVACIIIVLLLCFWKINKSYPTPEAFCAEQNIHAPSIVYGENSAFIMYQESASNSKFAFLKKTNKGYVSVGFHEVQKKIFGSDYSVIYAGNSTNEHYVVILLTSDTGIPQITDSLSSTFFLSPIELPDQETIMGYYALACIGEEPDTYYQNTYSFEISTAEDVNSGTGESIPAQFENHN